MLRGVPHGARGGRPGAVGRRFRGRARPRRDGAPWKAGEIGSGKRPGILNREF